VKAVGIVAAVLALLVAAPTSAAQTPLPVGQADGVRIVRERGVMVFVFTQRAAKLYRRIAGRRVLVYCTATADDVSAGTGGIDPISGVGEFGEPLRAPKRGRKLVTGDLRPLRSSDYCEIWLPARTIRRDGGRERIRPRLIVSVPLTQIGAVHLDERSKAVQLMEVLFAVALVGERRHFNGWPTYGVLLNWGFRKAGDRFVRLVSPTDTPPAGAIGYYSDGRDHVAVAIVSASGRRLFIEYDDDVLSTNVPGFSFSFPTPG
jgi:hypothetical protein